MQTLSFTGTTRTELGQKASAKTRKEGLVPCELYGGGTNVHFTLPFNEIKKIIYTPDFYFADITVDGSSHKCIIKDMQFHPITDALVHADFLALSEDRKVTVELPLKLVGSSKGALAGGKVMTLLRKIKVKGFPQDLIDCIEVDITELELGKSI
ncbi:UNVERIFIED_CONTAM: hypothetical protein GTU68_026171, partial [Idotea baltica]|nr:hypothetical protein [Idotea baltica]